MRCNYLVLHTFSKAKRSIEQIVRRVTLVCEQTAHFTARADDNHALLSFGADYGINLK